MTPSIRQNLRDSTAQIGPAPLPKLYSLHANDNGRTSSGGDCRQRALVQDGDCGDTGGGGLLGLVTATLLVVLSLEVFPGLADFDHDLGLRMRHFYVQRIANWSHGLHPDGADAPAFVFLDLEAEPSLTGAANESATAACRALQLARTQCRAATPGAPPKRTTKRITQRITQRSKHPAHGQLR